jgi:hypothetical protein
VVNHRKGQKVQHGKHTKHPKTVYQKHTCLVCLKTVYGQISWFISLSSSISEWHTFILHPKIARILMDFGKQTSIELLREPLPMPAQDTEVDKQTSAALGYRPPAKKCHWDEECGGADLWKEGLQKENLQEKLSTMISVECAFFLTFQIVLYNQSFWSSQPKNLSAGCQGSSRTL